MKKLICLFMLYFSLINIYSQNNLCSPTLFYDIQPGIADSNPENFTELNGILYFSTLYGLWKTDGTQEGTTLVHQTSFNQIKDIIIYNNQLLLSTRRTSPDKVSELWISNGNNVVPIKQFQNTDGFSGITNLTTANGYVIFLFNEENGKNKLWRTDGTTSGTIMVKDIDPTNSAFYQPMELVSFNDNVYFNAGTQLMVKNYGKRMVLEMGLIW